MINITIKEPAFEERAILLPEEATCFRDFFRALDRQITELMQPAEDVPADWPVRLARPQYGAREERITDFVMNALIGRDSEIRKGLFEQLSKVSSLGVRMYANDFAGRGRTIGEVLDLLFILTLTENHERIFRRGLVVEAKRLYANDNTYSPQSRFKEFNKLQSTEAGLTVRSLLQAKTMLEFDARGGIFLLYCPSEVDGLAAGSRAVYPETAFVLPRQPTLTEVLGDSLTFSDLILDHFFTGRRGFDFTPTVEKRLGDGDSPLSFHRGLTIDLFRFPAS